MSTLSSLKLAFGYRLAPWSTSLSDNASFISNQSYRSSTGVPSGQYRNVKTRVTTEPHVSLLLFFILCYLRWVVYVFQYNDNDTTPTQSPFLLADFENGIEGSRVYDIGTNRALTQHLVALCELTMTLTIVVVLLYPFKASFAHLGQKYPYAESSTLLTSSYATILHFALQRSRDVPRLEGE